MPNLNDDIINAQVPLPAPGVPEDQFVFQTIAELEMPPELAEFDTSIDPEYQAFLDSHADQLNSFAMPATSNYNSPYPGQATGNYDPRKQLTAPDITTAEGKMRALQNVGQMPMEKGNDIFGDSSVAIADPLVAGIRASSFDRYYAHPNFGELGWHPYADNEKYYNENSTLWDDMGRMWGEMASLTGTGFASVYRSWFSDDVMDLESAVEFEDAMRVGNSTKGGLGGGFNNLLLQSGYTFGIIGSIALEELAMWGATAALGAATPFTAGASGAAAVATGVAATARTAFNMAKLAKLGRRIKDSFSVTRMASASRKILQGLNNVDKARDTWTTVKAGGNVLGKILIPETMSAFKTLKTAQKAGENIGNIAKGAKAFGGFYRDLRSMNLALGEGRMEGGMVYKEHLAVEYSIQVAKNLEEGLGDVTPEQMAKLNSKAREAAFATSLWNAPAIYLSNQLLLGNAFGGFKRSLNQVMRDNIEGVGKRILRTKASVKGGKVVKDVFEDAGDSFMNLKYLYKSVRAGGIKGGAAMGAGAVALMKGSALSGLGEQWSGQGFHTFMSGFLMGGVVSGPQKLVFEGMPMLYQRTVNKEDYDKYKIDKDNLVNGLLETMNSTWNQQADDVTSMFDAESLNFISQKQANDAMQEAMNENSMLDHIDIKDEAKFSQLMTIFNTGRQDFYREQLQDYLKLTDEELGEAFPKEKNRAKSGKLRATIEDQIGKIDEMEINYNNNKDEMKNPFDPGAFKHGTREWTDEALKHRAYEHARMLYLFTKDGFIRAGERSQSIYEELSSDPIIANMAANDLTVLLSKDTLEKEISMLKKEVPGLGEAGTKRLKKDKEKKLAELESIAEVLYGKEYQTGKGNFDRRKIGKLTPKILSYLKTVARAKGDFVDVARIEEVIKKIVDHNHLSNRQRVYHKSLELLANPEQLDYISRRGYEYLKFAHVNKMEILEKAIRAFINKKEINQVLNEFLKLNVYIDIPEVLAFGATGNADVLKTFLNENGPINKENDPELWGKIQNIIQVYKQTTEARIVEEKQQEAKGETTHEASDEEIDATLEEAGIEGPESIVYGASKDESPVLQKVLEEKYKSYRAGMVKNGIKPMSFKNWLETAVSKQHIKSYNSLKKIWYQTLVNIKDADERDLKFNSDDGFTTWLSMQETNDLVVKILSDTNTEFKDFIEGFKEEETADKIQDVDPSLAKGKTKIVKIESKVKGEDVTFYKIVYDDGDEIPDEVVEIAGLDAGLAYTDRAKANIAKKKLDNAIPDDSIFEFDGISLQFGEQVVDVNTGINYIVIGTPNEVKRGGMLYLLPETKIDLLKSDKRTRNKAATKLKKGQFKGSYRSVGFSLEDIILPKNASKLRVDEATALLPHVNNKFKKDEEYDQLAFRRYQFLLQTLTPEELASLEVVVQVNENGGKITQKAFKFEKGDPNPYIKRTAQPYSIALKMPDALAIKMAKLLKENKLNVPTDGIVGYIPNGDILLFDENKNPILPTSITADQVSHLFNINRSKEDSAERIRNNFAIQFKIMDTIHKKLKGKKQGTFTLAEIGGVNFSIAPGFMDFLPTGQTLPISDLNYSTVDGNTVILINSRDKEGRVSSRLVTSFPGGDVKGEQAFEEKVMEEMKEQNVNMPGSAANTSRYVMIAKSPNGTYSYFPIKSDVLSKEKLDDISNQLVERSIETVKKNMKPVKGARPVVDNKNYNNEWNSEFNTGTFYVASNPGYTFDINVTMNSSLQLKVYDRDNKSVISALISDRSLIESYKDAEDKTELLALLFEEAQNELTNWEDSVNKNTPEARKEVLKRASKLKLDVGSIRESFDIDASAEEIASKTVSTVSPNVRKNAKLKVNIDGVDAQQIESVMTTAGVFTLTEIFTDAEGKSIPKGTPLKTASKTDVQDDPNSFDVFLLSDEEWTKLKEDDFMGLTSDQLESIARKMLEDADGLSNDQAQKVNEIMASDGAGALNLMVIKIQNEGKSTKQNPETKNDSSTTKEVDKETLRETLATIEQQMEAIKKEIFKRGLPISEVERATENDSRWKKLNKQKLDIIDKLSANKVVAENLSEEDVDSINEFLEWASRNLPGFITTENINTLGNNLKSGGERVGAFVMALNNLAGGENIQGTIYTGTSSKYAYHEAFHAVFRMLLTEEEQNQYYKLARKEVLAKLRKEGKSFKVELEKLKNSDIDKYGSLSKGALENLYYEEYMADEFEKFKQNPKSTKTDSWIKSLFNKIMEWLRSVLKRFNALELQYLYEGVDSGKFKTSSIAANSFTEEAGLGITVDASKVLRTKKIILPNGKEEFEYLDGKIGRQVISQISARVIMEQLKSEDPNFDIVESVKESLNLYKELYNINNPQYQSIQDFGVYENLQALNRAFNEYGKDIVDGVLEELELYEIKLQTTEDEDGEFEMAFGLRTTEQYDKDASMTGGFRSLPSFLRKYIGTTTLVQEKFITDSKGNVVGEPIPDQFGNIYLPDQEDADGNIIKEKIVVPVDFGVAYSGFLKAASGLSDPVKILQELYLFGQTNPQTKAVVTRLLNDLGITWEGQLEKGIIPESTNNNSLFQAVLKGFENFKVDYLFIHRRTKDNEIITYNAALRDDANTQIEKWADTYRTLRKNFKDNPELLKGVIKDMDALLKSLNNKKKIKEKTDESLIDLSKDISESLQKSLGIKISPLYIEFSIAHNIVDKTARQEALIKSKGKTVKPIEHADIMYMYDITAKKTDGKMDPGNLMADNDEGMYNRLRKLALGNAPFDETVGASVFKNPNGDLVYAHQLPTFHLKQVAALNDIEGGGAIIEEMIKAKPDKVNGGFNFLLNSPAFKQLSAEGRIKIQRIAGVKSSRDITQDSSGGVIEKYDRNEEGITYGDLNKKDFIAALLGAYTANVNSRSGRVAGVYDGKEEVALAPILLRVIEASNTGDMTSLPVIKAIVRGKTSEAEISDEALDAFINNIEAEFERILDENIPGNATYNIETGEGTLRAGYNADENGQIPDENGRAFKFHNTGSLLSPIQVKSVKQSGVGTILNTVEAVDRLRDGTQTIFLGSEGVAKLSGHNIAGQVKEMILQGATSVEKKRGRKTVKYLNAVPGDSGTLHKVKLIGKIKVDGINEQKLIDGLGDAISEEKTETHTHKWKTSSNKEFWVESSDTVKFLQGKYEKYIYEIVEEDISELSEEELKEQAETTEEERIPLNFKDIKTAKEVGVSTRNFYHGTPTKIDKLDPLYRQNLKGPIIDRSGNMRQSGSATRGTGIYLSNQLGFDPLNPTYTKSGSRQIETGPKITQQGENALKWTDHEGIIYETKLKPDAKIVTTYYKGTGHDLDMRNVSKKQYDSLREKGIDAIIDVGEIVLLNENAVEHFKPIWEAEEYGEYGKLVKVSEEAPTQVEEDYETAQDIVDQQKQQVGFKERLEKIIKDNAVTTELDLDIALKMIGESRKSLRKYVKNRIEDEVQVFEAELNQMFPKDKGLPKFITEGLKRPGDAEGDSGQFGITSNKLNLTTNRSWNIRQIFINDWVNTTAFNQLLLGDEAVSLKDAIDMVKRAKMQNAAYFSAASRIKAPELGVHKPLQEMSLFPMTDPVEKSIHSGKDIDHADAQLWMTSKAFRYMWFGFGKLTKAQAKLLSKIDAGEKVTVDDIYGLKGAAKMQEMLNSKKLVYGDGQTFIKMSAFTLTKQYTSYKDKDGNWVARPDRVKLHNMRVRMERFEEENDTISIAAPISALKMMKENISSIDDFVDNENIDKPLTVKNSMTLDANFMGLQVINPSNKLIITDPTQIKTILTGEQDDSVMVTIPDGEGGYAEESVGGLRAAYNKATGDRLTGKYLDKRNLIFTFDTEYAMDELHESIKEGAITPDLLSYLQYAQTSLKSSQSASELIEFFTYDEDTGEQKYPLDHPIVQGKFEQLFLSYFSKGVMAEKLPGISAALVSDYGINVYRRVLSVDENGHPDRTEIIRSDDFLNNYSIEDLVMRGDKPLDFSDDQSFDTLKTEVEKSKEKGVIILDRLRSNIKEYNDKGEYTGVKYTESLLPAHSKDVMREIANIPSAKIPDFIAKMFGIRIPSQDNHSTVNIKVVDFLPVYYGSSIISSRELVEVSGADFDIDKLYIQMKEYYSELVETKEKRKIYDVVVDMYEHETDIDATGNPVDIWVVDSLEQAQEQLDIIKNSPGGGTNFGEISKVKINEWLILHKKGDHKRIYLRGSQPKAIVKDKLRTKGEPYMKPIKRRVFKEYTDSYEDYVRYINKKVKKPGTTHNEALLKSRFNISNPLSDKEIEDLTKAGLNKDSIAALSELRLPRSKDEYNAYIKKNTRIPFSAPLDNKILDLKFALMGHSGVTESKDGNTPISYEGADIEILLEVWDDIKNEIPELAETANEEGLDANNLFAKWRGFGNNKEGAASIGAVVRPNLFLSLMQEYDLKLKSKTVKGIELGSRLQFNGDVFDKFQNIDDEGNDATRERLEDGSPGRRKQYILSALITAMTDNAKERLAAKLGLSIDALGVVATMTAMGVPIKTSILLMNVPAIKSGFFQKVTDPEFKSVKAWIKNNLKGLKGVIRQGGDAAIDRIGTTNVNQELLTEYIQDPIVSFNTIGELKIKIENAAESGNEAITIDEAIAQYDILTQFQTASEIAKFNSLMGKLMDLTGGFGKDMAEMEEVHEAQYELGLMLTDEEYELLPFDKKPLIDVRPIFKGNTWQARSLEIFNEFYFDLIPKVFLTQSKTFKTLYDTVLKNSIHWNGDQITYIEPEVKAAIKRDFLSMVTIKSYVHHLLQTDPQSAATLDNNIIYPNSDDTKSIIDIVEKAREVNGDKFNYFLDDFIRLDPATEEGNKIGISTAGANTLTRIGDSDKIDLQNGFKALFLDPKTRNLATDIMNYLMVKDGLQPTYKTLLAAVSPPALGKYLANIAGIKEAFAREDEELMKSIFGATTDELMLEFVSNYTLSARTTWLAAQVKDVPVFNPKGAVNVATRAFTEAQVNSKPNTLYVIFDNAAGNGTTNGRSVREMSNVLQIIIKKDNANIPENYYTPEETDAQVGLLAEKIKLIKEMRGMYDNVVFPPRIPAATIEGLQEHSPELYDELTTLLKDNFEYNIAGYKTDKEREIVKVNKEALQNPMHIDMSGNKGVLTISVLKGITSVPEVHDEILQKQPPVLKGALLKKLKDNQSDLRNQGIKFTLIESKGKKFLEAQFPLIRRVKVGNNWRYFKLAKLITSNNSTSFVSKAQPLATGSFAQYVEVEAMGSPGSWAGGFIFPNLQTNAQVKETVDKANPKPENEERKAREEKQKSNDTALLNAYTPGKSQDLDNKLEASYKLYVGNMKKGGSTEPMAFEQWLNTEAAIVIMEDHSSMKNVDAANKLKDDPNTSIDFDGKNVTLNGVNQADITDEIADAIEGGIEQTVFVIPGGEETVDDEGYEVSEEENVFEGGLEFWVTEFWESLSVPERRMLKDEAGIKTLDELIKEAKKDFYNSYEDFEEQIRKCFGG